MNFNPAWPYFVGMAALLGLSGLAATRLPAQKAGSAFLSPLEGLRGLLASSVFFHHAAITVRYLETGVWDLPPQRFYALLGSTSVSVFFFITGFLFWKQGRGELGWRTVSRFYLSRATRIGPPFWASLGLMLLAILCAQGFTLHETLAGLAREALSWASLLDPRGATVTFNGFGPTNLANAGVTWTLRIEVLFYLFFPAFWVFSRRGLWFAPIAAGYALTKVHAPELARFGEILMFEFSLGFLAAEITRRRIDARGLLRSRWAAGLAIATLAAQFRFVSPGDAYTLQQSLLLFPLFLVVCAGNDLFGLLNLPSTQFLGRVSYSFYLVHGIVLFAVFQSWPEAARITTLAPTERWAVLIACALLALIVSAAFHFAFEAPSTRLSRKLRWSPPPKSETVGA